MLFLVQRSVDNENDKLEAKQALTIDFRDCVGTARGRVSNKENFYDLYEAVRSFGPEAAKFADTLQERFDARYQKNTIKVPTDCLGLPEFKGEFTEQDIPPER